VYVNGPTPATGKVGSALQFGGPSDFSGSYVGVADSDLWAFGSNDFTIELWASFDTAGTGDLVHAGDILIGNDNGSGNINKWFFALGGGVLHFTVWNDNIPPSNVYLVRAPFVPIVGQWYHLAIVKSGTLFTIFVDGNPIGSEISTSPISNPNAPLTIGQAEGIGFMNGRLDEITIYNRALTQGELQAIFNAGMAGKCKAFIISTRALSAIQQGVLATQQLQTLAGYAPFNWSIIGGALPPGVGLSSDGTLSGTAMIAGSFPVTIGVTDSRNKTSQKDFTLDVLLVPPPPDVRIRKTGTQAVPGRISDYFILVENVGTTTVTNIRVVELVELTNFLLVAVNPPALADIVTLKDASMIPWNIESLGPGESTILSYQVKVRPTVPIGKSVTGEACLLDDPGALDDLLRDLAKCYLDIAGTLETCATCAPLCTPCPVICAGEISTFPACVGCVGRCAKQDPVG
jgi:hypothetical protein